MPHDYSKAVAMFGQAAKLKDPEAFDHLGTMFLRGTGVKKDVAKAARLFRNGARLGDSWSQLNLGEMYESGNFELPRKKKPADLPSVPSLTSSLTMGTPDGSVRAPLNKPDFARAMRLYSMSAAGGNRVAAFKLGQMFETGRGTTQDFSKALNFYRQSAAKQYAPAQLALGKAAEFGTGTSINLTYAYLWYSLAAEQDNAEAAGQLKSVTQKLSPAQLADAQSLLIQLEQKIRTN
jgi:TPR repeat protein